MFFPNLLFFLLPSVQYKIKRYTYKTNPIIKKSISKLSEEVANTVSNIPAGNGSNWNHPLLFISWYLLTETDRVGTEQIK